MYTDMPERIDEIALFMLTLARQSSSPKQATLLHETAQKQSN